MSFLNPTLLIALPIIALPIVIHLINQRRYQTIRWGAMMFLLSANRMSRGYARLRQWLIMLFRMLALAGLVFAISRPLASGWLGLAAGGRADTTIILLDRSPSMEQERAGTSKLETGRRQLVAAFAKLGSARWVLIESTTNTPRELESPEELARLPAAEATSASADLPAMLQAASDYIQTNQPGRTEVWLCSDMRQNDWKPDDARWEALREAFLGATQSVRFHLLSYPERAPDNVSVEVTEVRRRQTAESSELLVSLRLTRDVAGADGGVEETAGGAATAAPLRVPVQFDIEGARSELMVEMTASEHELKDHRIPLDRDRERGWGKVSVPADANPADNDFYFVFDQPVTRQTLIVSDDIQAAQPLQRVAAIPSARSAPPTTAEIATPDQLSTVPWEKLSLLLWQAPLPTAEVAEQVQSFVERGGTVVFFAPRVPTADTFAGAQWESWNEPPNGAPIQTWRGDQDLLAHTQSGDSLPVGQLQIRRYCDLTGEYTPLASLRGGATLLGRAPTTRGQVYFCATTPATEDSSLARDGVVFYVMVQRALESGAKSLSEARHLVAGAVALEQATGWRQVAGPPGALSTEFPFYAGVYATDDRLFAVNSSTEEEHASVVADDRTAALFQGLEFARVNDQAGNLAGLINEIWRAFLAAMIVALIVEAVLCLPRITPTAAGAPAGATL